MKRIFVFIFSIIATFSFAQNGSETIDYTTSSGDKGSFTITQIRGNQASANLQALDALSTTGIAVRTAANTWALRSLATGSNKLSLTNADGVLGNPSYDVNEGNLTLNNIGGTLGLAKGGTNATTAQGALNNLTGTQTANYVLSSDGTNTALRALSVAMLPTGIPNANLANSTINVAGLTLTLGGANTALNFSNLTGSATVAQLPTGIPNANLANSTITIEGVSSSLGGSYVRGSVVVTATGTDILSQGITICNPSASDITRTLPSSPPDGYVKTYQRINSTTGNTIIVPNSGQTLSTGTQVKLISQGRSVSFQYNLSATQWIILD